MQTSNRETENDLLIIAIVSSNNSKGINERQMILNFVFIKK